MGDYMAVDLPLPIPNPYMWYRVYDEHHVDGEVHQEEFVSLDEYVSMEYMVDYSQPLVRTDPNGLILFPGEIDMVERAVASDKSKKLIWSLVYGFLENERRGVCYARFGWFHILVSRMTGFAKLRVPLITEFTDEAPLSLLLQLNFADAIEVIWHLFGNRVPEDIQHLLDRMTNNFEEREHFVVHGSLIPMSNHDSLFKQVYEVLMCSTPPADLHAILSELHAEFPHYMARWRTLASSNHLLAMTLTHNAGWIYTQVVGPLPAVLTRHHKQLLDKLRIEHSARQHGLQAGDLILIEAVQFLMYLRNRPAHRLDHYFEHRANGLDDFNSTGSERVCHARLVSVLVFLQRALRQRGYGWRIDCRNLFGSVGGSDENN